MAFLSVRRRNASARRSHTLWRASLAYDLPAQRAAPAFLDPVRAISRRSRSCSNWRRRFCRRSSTSGMSFIGSSALPIHACVSSWPRAFFLVRIFICASSLSFRKHARADVRAQWYQTSAAFQYRKILIVEQHHHAIHATTFLFMAGSLQWIVIDCHYFLGGLWPFGGGISMSS